MSKKISSKIQIEIVDQIYIKKLKKYLDYCWIQEIHTPKCCIKDSKKLKIS